ncbi:hypothetical protein B0I37DRAFT_223197 [Chaetomium sp. MPI-CAGE-AT-0009]|nr:hypothetical protein B0I37DRAFT_223197 [Chaetomium sp. MPI-CAGE-AT-0009]
MSWKAGMGLLWSCGIIYFALTTLHPPIWACSGLVGLSTLLSLHYTHRYHIYFTSLLARKKTVGILWSWFSLLLSVSGWGEKIIAVAYGRGLGAPW